MSIVPFPPKRENELLAWSVNFNAKISATPTAYGLTAAQATVYAGLHTAFTTAYNAAINPNTNSKQTVIAKNQAKANLLEGRGSAWELVRVCQAFPNMTNALRGELGLRIPDVDPTPVPAPEFAPGLAIISTVGRVVNLRLRDTQNPDRRGKPDGVDGATVLYHVSATMPPNDPAVWTFLTNTSKTRFEVIIPSAVPAGSKVWFTAFWFNARKESSPAAAFQNTVIGDALSQAA